MANIKLKLSGIANVNTTKHRDSVYVDANSNLSLNSNRTDVITNTDISGVFGSLSNLIDYRPGQRILNPEYGLDLRGLLYEPMNDKTAQSIGIELFNCIKKWEPRIIIKNINVYPDYDDNTYYVTITMNIQNLNNSKDYEFTKAIKRGL